MKKFFRNAAVLAFGFGMAFGMTACHHSDDAATPTIVSNDDDPAVQARLKHSVTVTVLNTDGTALNGASVKFYKGNSATGTSLFDGTLTGNTWSKGELEDGTYTIVVSKAADASKKFKSVEESFDLKVVKTEVDGEQRSVAQNVDKVYFIAEDVTSTAVVFGSTETTDEIVIETTEQTQTDENGNEETVTTTDEDKQNEDAGQITVQGESGTITGDANDSSTDLGFINQQIQDQSNGEEDVTDFSVTLSNITSLEDAQAVARLNRVVSNSRQTRATTSLPDGSELLAGVAVNAGPYVIEMPAGQPFSITINMPDPATRDAVTLFYTVSGEAWIPLTVNTDLGISEIVRNPADSKVVIKMNKLRTMSFAFGIAWTQEVSETTIPVVGSTWSNPTDAYTTRSTMEYTVKAGTVLKNTVQGPLTDFLRKIVLRLHGSTAVATPKDVKKTYTITPAWQVHPYGTLTLSGTQTVTNIAYRIGTAAGFDAVVYGAASVAVNEEYPEIVVTHNGGSDSGVSFDFSF